MSLYTQTQKYVDSLTDEQLVAANCKSLAEIPLKLADFNNHKRRIQDELARTKKAEIKLNPYSGYVGRSKTKCQKGHDLTEANSYLNRKDGSKICKICARNYASLQRKMNNGISK